MTIIPRGRALGVTMQLPTEDKFTYRKQYVEAQIAILMGGRVAEELSQDDITTGAGNDIERATEMARRMVCEWGMSELGPLAFGAQEEPVFLGRDFSQRPAYSEDTAIQIDREVSRIVNAAYEYARSILTEQRDLLDRLAHKLLERETLDGEEVYNMIRKATGREAPGFHPPVPLREVPSEIEGGDGRSNDRPQPQTALGSPMPATSLRRRSSGDGPPRKGRPTGRPFLRRLDGRLGWVSRRPPPALMTSAPPAAAAPRSALHPASPRSLALPRGRTLPLDGRARIMGILNLTPDSFSDGGLWSAPERAVEHGLELLAEGRRPARPGGRVDPPGRRRLRCRGADGAGRGGARPASAGARRRCAGRPTRRSRSTPARARWPGAPWRPAPI